MQEIWRDIPDYEGLYQVSNLGRVKSLNYNRTNVEKILKLVQDRNGYLIVKLSKKGKAKLKKVHRLVAQAFIPNPNNLPQINHKNEIVSDNISDNLEWCTAQYNKEYSSARKIIQKDISGRIIKLWNSMMQIERELNIPNSCISYCCKKKGRTTHGYIWEVKDE